MGEKKIKNFLSPHAHTHTHNTNLHCIRPRFHPHQHTPWRSWEQYPTSQAGSRWHGQPQASKPAAAYQLWGLRLKHTGRVYYHHPHTLAVCQICSTAFPQAPNSQSDPNFQFRSNPPPQKVSAKISCMWFSSQLWRFPWVTPITHTRTQLVINPNIALFTLAEHPEGQWHENIVELLSWKKKYNDRHINTAKPCTNCDLLYTLPHPVM